jgi:hypothetical protein
MESIDEGEHRRLPLNLPHHHPVSLVQRVLAACVVAASG